jgi:hypothetical protein
LGGLIGFIVGLIEVYPDDAGYGLIGMAGGLLPGMIAARPITTRLEQPYNRWLEKRTTRYSYDAPTDVRRIAELLPKAQPFDHANYCKSDRIFLALGLDAKGKPEPITVPLDVWRKTHLELIGAPYLSHLIGLDRRSNLRRLLIGDLWRACQHRDE